MFELDGIEYSTEDLQRAASKYDMDFDSYLENMKGKGLVEKQADSTVDPTVSQDDMGSQSAGGSSESQENDTFIERALGKNFITDYIGDIYRAGEQGLAQGATVDEAFDVYKKGKNISDEELKRYIEVNDALSKTGASDEMLEYEKIKEEAGGGVWGFMKGMVMTRGQVIPQVIVSSAAGMARTFFDSEEAAAAAGGGAITAGTVGSFIPVVGTATGAIGGAVAGLTGSMETALTLTDLLKTKLDGKDFNQENIRAILEDDEAFDDIKSKALARGATIGAIEGITVGLSRGVGARLLLKGAGKSKIARQVTGIEVAGGSGGEALGQVAAGQEFDIAEVLMEGVAEAKGVVNVADILAKKDYKVNGEKRTRKELLEILNNPNTKAEDLAKINFEVLGDNNLNAFIKEKQKEAVFETQIDERISDVDRKKLVQLEKKRQKAELDTNKKGIFAVPDADSVLENIENDINSVIEKYANVDRKASDVIARKKVAKEVKAVVAERVFQSNMAFAKKHSELYGLKFTELTQAEIIEKYKGTENADLANSLGGIIGDQIIINKDLAKTRVYGDNVGNHELLHGIIKASKANITQETIDDFLNVIGKDNAAKIQKRLSDNYDADYISKNLDEYFTAFSDAIKNEEIAFNDSVFTKIADVIRRMFASIGLAKVDFESGRGAYNFLKDYNKSIHKGSLSSGIARATKGDGTSETLKASKSGFEQTEVIEDLGLKETTADIVAKNTEIEKTILEEGVKDEQGNIKASPAQQRKLAENNLPRAFALAKQAAGRAKDLTLDDALRIDDVMEFYSEYSLKLTELARTYKAQMTDGTKVPFGAYMNSLLPLKYSGILDKLKSKIQTTSISDETVGKKVASVEAETTTKSSKPVPKIQRARVLKSLADVNLDNKEIISDTARDKIKVLIEQSPKNLEAQITKIIEKEITKAVKAQMGKISNVKGEVVISDEYKAFIALNYENIVQGLDVNTIKNNYKTLFELTEIGKEDRKTRKADKPSLKKDSNYRKSIFKIETNKAKFTKFFTEGGYTTLLARQKGLANQIAKAITENAINNEIIENSSDNKAIINAKLKNYANKLNKQKNEVVGNYADQIKFSKSKAAKDVNDGVFLSDQIVKNGGPGGIYKKGVFPPRLIKNPRKISYEMQEFVFNEIYADGNLAEFSAKELKAITTAKILQKVGKTYANTNNGAIYEQFIIDVAKNIPGITVLSETMAEGGIPDLHVQLHGKDFFVEVKMANAQYSSITISEYDIAKNKWKIKKEYDFNDQINALVKKASKGVKAAQKYINEKEITDPTTKKPFVWKMFGQPIPTEAIQMLKDAGLYNGMMAIDSFDINNIGEMYRGKEYPVHYIHIQGKGLFHMGKNPLGLPVPQLTGDATITLRRVPSTQYRVAKESDNLKGGIFNKDGSKKNVRTGYTTLTYRAIPIINAKSVPRSNHSIGNNLTFNELVETKEVQALKMSKSAKEKQTINNAVKFSRSANNPTKGITVLDFDDTLATSKSSVLFTAPDGTTGKLTAEEFAKQGADLLAEGYVYDFSEFNKVVKGKKAPLFEKALKLQSKFGPENMFILTARPAESAASIFEFIKANGLNIPLKNITGLANSTAEAKALWMVEKVSEGYNDFYFADDALQNVQAVDNILEQFDVKRKVQQARIKFSKSMNENFNDILENVTGIESQKRFSAIKGRKRGESKGKFRFFIPPSHEDFVGLLYNFMGKGRVGDSHRDFFENALIRPLNRANREYDTARQSVANDYKTLNKQFEDVRKKLTKKTSDGDFTFQDAIRVYLWNKHSHKIPGLSPTDQQSLVDLVANDPELRAYAETLNVISKQDTYVTPTEGWNSGDIRMDLDDATGRIGRQQFFAEFIENADVIFSEENLNKIEAGYGKGVRSSLEDMLYRIKTGRNRPTGQNAQVNKLMNYLNGSVGTVMFFNMRSALLQQMSLVNYINFADNNMFAAAKAFANQKQYWSDWSFIFNSDMLKQRRGGIQTDVNGAELAASLRNSKDITRKLISKLLELGFLPTQIGDNIAIATGGATYYRNRINTYLKQGLSKKEAEAKAFTDFQAITQSTQQSARPDMVSKQQASVIGKVILNFQNVTSQFNRLGKKAFQDIYNRRITKPNTNQMQSDISNAARITYYFAVQNAIFYTLQTALFAMMFGDDEEDDNKLFLKKKERLINGSIDSVLRGSGLIGGVVATLKNVAIAFARQRDVDYNPDESSVALEALNLSPVLGIKLRKIVNAEKTLNYNKKVIKEMETLDIDNPQWSAVTNYVESLTNVPLNRLYNKTQNVRQALNNEHSAWERSLMFLGWSQYNLNLENKKMEDIKESVKSKKKNKKKSKNNLRDFYLTK